LGQQLTDSDFQQLIETEQDHKLDVHLYNNMFPNAICDLSSSKRTIFCKEISIGTTTEFVTDLDIQSEMIIFGLLFTTFELSIIFGGSWGSIENWLEPKTKPP